MTSSETRIRVLNIFSNLQQSRMFELTAQHLDQDRFDFRALLLNPASVETCHLERSLTSLGIPTDSWNFSGTRDYASALLRLTRRLKTEKCQVVHTHLRWASYVGIPAARMAGVPARLLTRWHAAEHHREHPGSVKYDRIVNTLATHIITPGRVTYRIVTDWEHVPEAKVTLLNPPLDVDAFRHPAAQDIALLRSRYNPESRSPVIGVISRWVEWKGVQYIVPAVGRLLERYPDALLLLFNASGHYSDALRALLSHLPARNYRVTPYEPKAAPLYRIFDVFVHVPVDELSENTGGVYSEALVSGVPCIFTLSGTVTGMVQHMKHCYIVPYRDSDAIYEGLRTLLDQPDLARRLGAAGSAVLPDAFRPEVHVRALQELYTESVAPKH